MQGIILVLIAYFLWVSSNAISNAEILTNLPTSYNTKAMEMRYQRWMNEHKKQYNDLNEWKKRFKIYQSNVQFIDNINSKNLSYKLTDNKFADMTHEEFRSAVLCQIMTGITPSDNHGFINHTYQALPHSVDWRIKGAVTPVKDQGQCGSCWAFAAITAVESLNQIKTGKLVLLSEQELVDCDRSEDSQGCKGGEITEAFKYMSKKGIATEEVYPYTGRDDKCDRGKVKHNAVKITGYKAVPADNEKKLQAVVALQPVAVAIHAPLEFQLYKEGVFDAYCGTHLNHGVTIVGYGKEERGQKYWIVKNSWGTDWGENGYVRMRRDIESKTGLCGLATRAAYPI